MLVNGRSVKSCTMLAVQAAGQALAGGASAADASALAAEGTDPAEDIRADRAYGQHLARVLTRRALEHQTPTFTDASLIAAGTGALLWAVLAAEASPWRRTGAGLAGFAALEAAVFTRYTDIVVLGCAAVAVTVAWRLRRVPRAALGWWLGSVVVFAAGVATFDGLVYGGRRARWRAPPAPRRATLCRTPWRCREHPETPRRRTRCECAH